MGLGKGYIGNKMSVNAHEAYRNSEMPLSKWTKKAIIDEIDYLIEFDEVNVNLELLKKLPLKKLQDVALEYTCYHHTSMHFNVTDFYAIDVKHLNNLTDEDINKIIVDYKAELEATKAERLAKKAELEAKRAVKRQEKELKATCEAVLSFSTYKTVNGLYKAVIAGRVDLKELEAKLEAKKAERELSSLYSTMGMLVKFEEVKYSNFKEMKSAFEAGEITKDEVKELKRELIGGF